MSKLRVTLTPLADTVEFECEDPGDREKLAARVEEEQVLYLSDIKDHLVFQVSVEKAEWDENTGRFGTGEAEREQQMLERMAREAEEARGLQ